MWWNNGHSEESKIWFHKSEDTTTMGRTTKSITIFVIEDDHRWSLKICRKYIQDLCLYNCLNYMAINAEKEPD